MEQPHSDIERLYRELGPMIWAYLRRQPVAPDEADEILQETFVVVAANPAAVRAAASQRAWLFGIARNLLREHVRRHSRRRSEPLPEDFAAPSAPAGDGEEIEAMRRAIAGLPEAQREVLELRLREDLSYKEIAEVLEVPIGTVRSRLHHAVRALRERVAAARAALARP